MPKAVSLLPLLLALMGYALAGLNIWPSFHVALSNASVFVDFSTKCNSSAIRKMSLSLINMENNATLLTRTLPTNQSSGRVEFDCSCFLYAGTFRFLLGQTSTASAPRGNGTEGGGGGSVESTTWWWSSELQVQWPTFHIAVAKAGNHSGHFQVGISTYDHFQACSSLVDTALFLEVSYVEYNQIGRNSIDKVQARTQHPIKLLRSQTVQLPCAFPFTDRDFIQLALRSPHTAQEVKRSEPFYLSRIFSYKLLVENANAYRSGCVGMMAVKLVTPPCAHVNGKVLLYKDVGVGVGVASGTGAGGTATMGFGAEEPSSPPLAFNWLTQGENETEFNCSVFYPGRNKYCFRFVFNFSRSPSPAQTCLLVHKSAETWGPWQQWSVCSVSCGEGVRERVRKCLLPSGLGGMRCTGMVKEQSLCSLEDCVASPAPSPSMPPVHGGITHLGGNMVVVVGISLCLAVILVSIIVTLWRKLCQTPQCSSVRTGSVHSPGGRKLSDEASICGHSLQRPSLSDSHGVGAGQNGRSPLSTQPLSQTLVMPLSPDSDRLSPTGQKLLPPIFGYRLAQQQLKEMKKKGLREATQLYHVSSSPVHDTLVETSASPTASPVPTPLGFTPSASPLALQDDSSHGPCCATTAFSELPSPTPRSAQGRLSPRVELVLGPQLSGRAGGGSSKWRDRTADWVEMVERSGMGGLRGGVGEAGTGNSFHNNPNFRRTSSFNDTKPQLPASVYSKQFRERSMTQVGSRTLPEGSSWTRGGKEKQPYYYAIPEHGAAEWTKFKPPRAEQRKPWSETAELKHTGTNTSAAPEKHSKAELGSTAERQRSGEAGGRGGEGISGIGGPVIRTAASQVASKLSVDRAEQNWSRRGPSPIQRNMLARKLKEAQSCSAAKGRQRSSTFSVASPEQRKGRCRSLPMSGVYNCNDISSYRLSEAEQQMLDLDLSSAYVNDGD